MKTKQKSWEPGGWRIMLTWGQSFGIGLFTSASWIGLRCNGIDLMFGPLTLTIQPPMPAWLQAKLSQSKADQ